MTWLGFWLKRRHRRPGRVQPGAPLGQGATKLRPFKPRAVPRSSKQASSPHRAQGPCQVPTRDRSGLARFTDHNLGVVEMSTRPVGVRPTMTGCFATKALSMAISWITVVTVTTSSRRSPSASRSSPWARVTPRLDSWVPHMFKDLGSIMRHLVCAPAPHIARVQARFN